MYLPAKRQITFAEQGGTRTVMLLSLSVTPPLLQFASWLPGETIHGFSAVTGRI